MATNEQRDQVKREGGPKFTLLPNVLYDEWAARLGPYATLVYVALSRYADYDDGSSFPSVATISKKLAMSEATVKRAIRRLEAEGLVRVERRQSDKGNFLSNVYWLRELKAPEGVGSHRTQGGFPQNPGVGSHRATNKTQENETQELSAAPRPRNALLDALAVLCFGSLDAFKLKGVPAQLQRAASDLRAQDEGVAADDVTTFQEWWKAEHWRGKRGERPKPHEVGAEFLLYRQRPASGEAQPVFDETTGRVTWQY